MSKYVVEFGNQRGLHVDNLVVPTKALAERLATSLVMVFKNDQASCMCLERGDVRVCWRDEQHFVALSKLDGVPRGPASSALWK